VRARIIVGDCRASMATLPDASVDAVVCDPPYELGFMGKAWDASGIAYDLEVWRQALRVLKPGGHLLAFSGSRTYHRMACAIEDAGFDIRDQIMWVYGSGFPKSLDVSKAIDKAAGAAREVVGSKLGLAGYSCAPGKGNEVYGGGIGGSGSSEKECEITAPATDAARQWSGWGTALKPAHEPICMARKPLQGTVAANVLRHGTGAINVDGCRVGDEDTTRPNGPIGYHGGGTGGTGGSASGRWPANFIHDGSEEATAGLGEAARFFYCAKASRSDREEGCDDLPLRTGAEAVEREEGSAGMDSPRAGAGRTASTVQNHHPTVKPTDLMRYLVRMVTPLGGTVLDPFTGSGSTGRAAMLEGAQFIGCELSPEYAEIARARIRYTLGPLFAHEVE
jgi:site-specific DNA-methyltransferase (adenine-specific)